MILRRRKIHKNSVFVLITILLVVGVFGIGGETFAQQTQTIDQFVTEKANWLNLIMNAIYVFLWPVLIIAGKSLDNSLIYAEFLWLDAPLRTFWNITKNFANFTLGFLVLWEIIKNIFAVGDKGKAAFGVIKKALIWGIWIQASWFLLAALIDISTIATVGIGWLPLSILHWDNAPSQCLADKQVLGVGSQLDTSNTTNSDSLSKWFNHYYFTKAENGTKRYYSPCLLDEQNPNYIIGKQYYTWQIDGQSFQNNVCVLFGSRIAVWNEGWQIKDETSWGVNETNAEYINYIKDTVQETGFNREDALEDQQVFSLFSGYAGEQITTRPPSPGIYNINDIAWNTANRENDLSLGSILSYAEGMMGPLITLYSSIVNFAELNDTRTHQDSRDAALSMIIKAVAAIALFIPLIFLAIVLLLRIAYIWLYIIVSPFIVLIMTFGDKVWSTITEAAGDIFKIDKILKTIFAPVIVVFALSIGLLFMTVLSQGLANVSDTASCDISTHSQIIGGLDIEQSTDKKCYNILTFQICFDQETNFFGGIHDPLAWVLINLFAIAIMRFIVFAALEFIGMKRFGGWNVVNKWLAWRALGSLPIVPMPTKDGGWTTVWANTAGQHISRRMDTAISNVDQKARERLEQKNDNKSSGSTNNTTANQNTSIATQLAGWTPIDKLEENNNTNNPNQNLTVWYNKTDVRNFIKNEVEKIDQNDKAARKAERDKQLQYFQKNLQHMTKDEFTATINATDEFALRMRPLPWSYIKLNSDKIYQVTYTNKQFSLDEVTDPSITASNNYDAVQTAYDNRDTELTADAVDARLAQQNTQTPPVGWNTPPNSTP